VLAPGERPSTGMGRERSPGPEGPAWPAEAGRYLSSHLRPRLAREGERSLAEVVRRAVEARDLGRLAALSPREKRILLGALDRELEERGGRGASPRTVVDLTGLFGPELGGEGPPDRRPVAPSR
jgi:hypothetical protein